MKKNSTGYTALCCLMSACMILLYHTGAFFMEAQAKEEESAACQIPDQSAGVQVYLDRLSDLSEEEASAIFDFVETGQKKDTDESMEVQEYLVQDAFCRQAETMNVEPAIVADVVTDAPLIQLNSNDYECLLKIVQSEAGICDQKGKILVANVILNRMQSQYFPDTVEDVVYQENQFSPVENGSIDKVSITEETRQAVSMALSGTDYSEGALFFAARNLADEKNMAWFDESLDFLFEHDGHEFFTLKE